MLDRCDLEFFRVSFAAHTHSFSLELWLKSVYRSRGDSRNRSQRSIYLVEQARRTWAEAPDGPPNIQPIAVEGAWPWQRLRHLTHAEQISIEIRVSDGVRGKAPTPASSR
ncbi:hypothetical protein CR103_14090 [Massilia psychrophila]|uniref:Uncharacterized protein n=1 Tax=Massilia psychrophila TaxID=1603353 RepID=A0A2G8SZS5_9BURK|nr:hypothetical protein CR103_14090 [Massilia psychrophila]